MSKKPISMILVCPACGGRHIDEGRWKKKPHHTHACQHCGHVWRPAVEDTVGVQFLPGFYNGPPQSFADELYGDSGRERHSRLAEILTETNPLFGEMKFRKLGAGKSFVVPTWGAPVKPRNYSGIT